MTSPIVLSINAVICMLIVLRILTYRRSGAQYHRKVAWYAWALLVACFAVFIRTLTGDYQHLDWSEMVMNFVFMIAIYAANGNVSKLINADERE